MITTDFLLGVLLSALVFGTFLWMALLEIARLRHAREAVRRMRDRCPPIQKPPFPIDQAYRPFPDPRFTSAPLDPRVIYSHTCTPGGGFQG